MNTQSKLDALAREFKAWMTANGIARDAGDASEILASGKLDEPQTAFVRDFINRWERTAEPYGERWHAERATAGDSWHVLDENRLRVATVHRSGNDAKGDAYLLAAAPALADALNRLYEWVENNVAYGTPRALAEDCGQALEDSMPPQ
jgi:hypothetical protein